MEHFFKKIHGWFDYQDHYQSIVEKLPNNFTFAEVGVWKGRSLSFFAVEVINSKKQGNIYAIDHWRGSPEHINPYSHQYESLLANNPDGVYNLFLQNIEPIKEYIKVIRKPSIEAAKDFANESLDAIFIDGGHEYNDVIQDLHTWYPKIKHGGIFSGHDYFCDGVTRATAEFCREKNKTLQQISACCWIIK